MLLSKQTTTASRTRRLDLGSHDETARADGVHVGSYNQFSGLKQCEWNVGSSLLLAV